MTCTRPQAESQKNPLTRGRRPHMTRWMVRPCVASGFRRVGGERFCINVSGLCFERFALLAASRFEPIALPDLRLDQHNPSHMHEQNPQVTIAVLGYLAAEVANSGLPLLIGQS